MARAANRHLRILLSLGSLGLVSTGAVNLAVNPWRVLPRATEVKSLDPYRDIDAEIRTCKAGLAIRGPWEVLVLGSSRPNTGIDPGQPALAGRGMVNLGLPGGDMFETRAMLEYALKHQQPKQVILFVDAGDLTRPDKLKIENDMEFSPLSNREPVEGWLSYLFSQRAVDASGVALTLAVKQKTPAYSQEGFHRKKPPRLNYFETMEQFYLPWVMAQVEEQKRDRNVKPAKLAIVRAMLEACRSRSVSVILAIPPNHLTLSQAMEEASAPDPWFMEERRALAGLVAEVNGRRRGSACQLWDLNIPSPVVLEPFPPVDRPAPMANWLDPVHFTPAAGERYMLMLLEERPDDDSLGLRVDDMPTEEYLAEVSRRYEAARPALPAEREGIRKALYSPKR